MNMKSEEKEREKALRIKIRYKCENALEIVSIVT